MRTKLLKKIRKRYEMIYFSKQVDIYSTTFKGQCMALRDKNNSFRGIIGVEICLPQNCQKFWEYNAQTKEEAKLILLKQLCTWIEKDYRDTRTRKPKQTIETIWYKKLKK